MTPTRATRDRWAASTAKKQGQKHAYRTVCTSAVIEYFGIRNFRLSQCIADVVRILRTNGMSVRSRASAAGRAMASVGQVRSVIRSGKLSDDSVSGRHWFLIRVDGHVLLLDSDGNTIVDTAPRKRDRRKVYKLYKIERAA